MTIETDVLSLYHRDMPIEEIALQVDQPIAIIEEIIDASDEDLETAKLTIIDISSIEGVELNQLKGKILACTDHLTNETMKHINNEFALNRIGKASQILKNLSDTAVSNADGLSSNANRFSKYFKA